MSASGFLPLMFEVLVRAGAQTRLLSEELSLWTLGLNVMNSTEFDQTAAAVYVVVLIYMFVLLTKICDGQL